MEFGKSVKKGDGVPKLSIRSEDNLLAYPFPVNFYSVPPTGDLELDEAEFLVTERIKCRYFLSFQPS